MKVHSVTARNEKTIALLSLTHVYYAKTVMDPSSQTAHAVRVSDDEKLVKRTRRYTRQIVESLPKEFVQAALVRRVEGDQKAESAIERAGRNRIYEPRLLGDVAEFLGPQFLLAAPDAKLEWEALFDNNSEWVIGDELVAPRHPVYVCALANGAGYAVGFMKGEVLVFDAEHKARKLLRAPAHSRGFPFCMLATRDSRHLVVATRTPNRLSVYDLATGEFTRNLERAELDTGDMPAQSELIKCMWDDSHGRVHASISELGKGPDGYYVRGYDPADGWKELPVRVHPFPILSACVDKDDNMYASVFEDLHALTPEGKLTTRFPGDPVAHTAILLSRDQQYVITLQHDGVWMHVYTTNGELVAKHDKPASMRPMRSAVLLPDNSIIFPTGSALMRVTAHN